MVSDSASCGADEEEPGSDEEAPVGAEEDRHLGTR